MYHGKFSYWKCFGTVSGIALISYNTTFWTPDSKMLFRISIFCCCENIKKSGIAILGSGRPGHILAYQYLSGFWILKFVFGIRVSDSGFSFRISDSRSGFWIANIKYFINKISRLYYVLRSKSSTSLPGENQVDGLPPVFSDTASRAS